jgi:hypothetical protein
MSEIETLSAAFRESVIGSEDGHLGEDQWERLACDEMAPDERESVLDHIVDCPSCSDTYRAIRIIRSEALEFDTAVPAPMGDHGDATVRRFPFRTLGLLAMAATVVLAVVLPMHFLREPVIDGATMVVRSVGDEAAVVPVSPVGTVVWSRGDDILMEWTVVEGPVPAFVEILDADGELIWTGPEVGSTEVKWHGGEIPGPGRFYWRVITRNRQTDVSDSELMSFDLSANRP